jgi:hypothetical protein
MMQQPLYIPEREACCYPDNLNRVDSPLVERLTPDQELIPGRTELGALTESGRPLGSGLLQYMISFLFYIYSVSSVFYLISCKLLFLPFLSSQ